MTNKRSMRDPLFEREAEDAQGTESQIDPYAGSLEKAREEAQGIEVFEDPDATLSADALMEGAPGQETLTEDSLGRGVDGEEDERIGETGR